MLFYRQVYYKDAFGALVVFDQGSQESFDGVLRVRSDGRLRSWLAFAALLVTRFVWRCGFVNLQWKGELDGKVTLPDGSQLPTLLVANKDDLEHKEVDKDILDGFSREHEFSGWIATSAKTNYNVDAALRQLVSHILKHENALEMQAKAQRSHAEAGRVEVAQGRGGARAEESGCC